MRRGGERHAGRRRHAGEEHACGGVNHLQVGEDKGEDRAEERHHAEAEGALDEEGEHRAALIEPVLLAQRGVGGGGPGTGERWRALIVFFT